MTIKLHNTLSKKKEEFQPEDSSNVRMYVCGPTVYDRAHIGNARAVVVFDALYRLLRHEYGDDHVTYVRNITDVDDKINAAAKERGISISELTTQTTKMFHDDMAKLNCLLPNKEPRATDHIAGMIEMSQKLIENGNAYAADGHVLFSTSSYDKYGNLSNRTHDEMIAGARVEIAPYKKDPADFVLWKPSAEDEPGWDSPWGRGRPGWHLECSVMSTKYLGQTFDIHGGGADLQFPHHENEIAQSCCTYPGSKFARYWVHNGFLSVEGEKMSKSLGNFITVHDLLEKGIQGEVIRYALLATHYKKPLDWTEKALSDAKKSLDSFHRALEGSDIKQNSNDMPQEFIEALSDDLNTPLALSALHQLVTKINKSEEKLPLCIKLNNAINFLGLNNNSHKDITPKVDHGIENLIQERNAARASKNWAESDRIRDELAAKGIVLEDKPDGTTIARQK